MDVTTSTGHQLESIGAYCNAMLLCQSGFRILEERCFPIVSSMMRCFVPSFQGTEVRLVTGELLYLYKFTDKIYEFLKGFYFLIHHQIVILKLFRNSTLNMTDIIVYISLYLFVLIVYLCFFSFICLFIYSYIIQTY